MIMDLVMTVIIKIIFVSVDLKIVLALLLEKVLDGGYLKINAKKYICLLNKLKDQEQYL